ncbi:hypothetical protein M5X00_10255 [Paenibacillus alvei]|uniref:Uncharacterized protein n=1 Tax=Paenibacillus alvei TaxID=44250 RepID=A0ABT4GTB9_PAEAL|nr:hypothetical protein [Paenibacillus alvei]EJW17924.1 hypothetical protein PAV_3c03730 [Paenibacillus alvei DSM 29]MCY7483346.1 hypothetical protein [Paenibacillus alvei]MCY9543843.1 hypothetical protein [Paenibacillus alvei]MCY9703428.1 hypothetical protein [Paenibacillus alvei]MCY9732310.1 hypothetical protein [Paenibacillus alvei]
MISTIHYQLRQLEGSTALYAYGTEACEKQGLFEVDFVEYERMCQEGLVPSIEETVYLIRKSEHDPNFYGGIRVFFHLYKHYLQHGAYAEEYGQMV